MLCDFANVGDFKEHTDLESSKRLTPCGFARSSVVGIDCGWEFDLCRSRLPVPTASSVR